MQSDCCDSLTAIKSKHNYTETYEQAVAVAFEAGLQLCFGCDPFLDHGPSANASSYLRNVCAHAVCAAYVLALAVLMLSVLSMLMLSVPLVLMLPVLMLSVLMLPVLVLRVSRRWPPGWSSRPSCRQRSGGLCSPGSGWASLTKGRAGAGSTSTSRCWTRPPIGPSPGRRR